MATFQKRTEYEYRRVPKRHGPSSMFFKTRRQAEDAMAADETGTPVGVFVNGKPVAERKRTKTAAAE